MTKRHQEAAASSPADLAIVDLIRLLGRLRAGQLRTLLMAAASILVGTFLLGQGTVLRRAGSTSPPLADTFKRHSASQEAMRGRPAVRAFEGFLTNAASERWAEAYSLLASAWKSRLAGPLDLARDYRMTQRHEFHYYIPTSITDDQESWDVEFSYWDYFPELAERDLLIRQPLGELLSSDRLKVLSDEISRQVALCYRVESSDAVRLQTAAEDYLAREATIRDVVLRDDLVEILGARLQLLPVVSTESTQGKHPAQERRRVFHVCMLKEGGDWRVDSYDSYLVEKR